jgi:hypothetical protein
MSACALQTPVNTLNTYTKELFYQLQMASCCKEKFHTFLAEKIGISLNVLIPNSLSKNFEG